MAVSRSIGGDAYELFYTTGLETFRQSNYYFYPTVINNLKDKNLKAHSLSYARQARSPWLAVQVWIIVAGIALLAVSSSARTADRSNASPELVIDATRRDFGDVFIGEELDQIFTVRNVGTAPLELANKPLTAHSAAPGPGQVITASSADSRHALGNYLKPASAVKRPAAPT